MEKTNAMRLLDRKKIPYCVHSYEGVISGPDVAAALGQDPGQVFKTLVTVGKTGAHYVFMLPVCQELDLKKAAAAVGEKSISMLPQKALFPLTGYVHGGCSPLGMKKSFPTVIHHTALLCETIFFSAGRIGLQIQASAKSLQSLISCRSADITLQT